MHDRILIADFGSQYTQLIARRIRELHVYCEIHPFDKLPVLTPDVKGIVLSGSPYSVRASNSPSIDLDVLTHSRPVLGICYGAQLIAHHYGGTVLTSEKREYGRARLSTLSPQSQLLQDMHTGSQVWMSHADTITKLPEGSELIASTSDVEVAAYRYRVNGNTEVYGIQFHPEVSHSEEGKALLRNFVINICGCKGDWTAESFIAESIAAVRNRVKDEQVVMAISGGVDSTVAGEILKRAIGDKLHGIFVDNGLLRKNEFQDVLDTYRALGFNVHGVDARKQFYSALTGVSDPEQKRKVIGRTFIEVFDAEAHRIKGISWLGQGTIYPDVIESLSVHGPSQTIKSHHNVGGLPERMKMKVIEPLRMLFKDEVREVGTALGLPSEILTRHPFPGPGLGIRILSEVTADKVRLLQEADDIFITALKEHELYDKIWQAGAVLLPVQSVGVMGDERTYEYVLALRAVTSIDGMTADWARLPDNFLQHISTAIINRVKGINRVVYDISTKPPATIEWE
jgi:GMP synthase (glutamine-hydrolysing)